MSRENIWGPGLQARRRDWKERTTKRRETKGTSSGRVRSSGALWNHLKGRREQGSRKMQ